MRSIVIRGGGSIEGILHVHKEDYDTIYYILKHGYEEITHDMMMRIVCKYDVRYEPFPHSIFLVASKE